MREKFSARTIFIPFISIIGFFTIQLIVTAAYMIAYVLIKVVSGSDSNTLIENLTYDSQNFIMEQMNTIGIIYSVIIAVIAAIVLSGLLRKNPIAVRREKIRSHELIAAAVVMIGAAGLINLEMAGISALGEFVPWLKSALQTYIDLSKSLVGSKNIFLIIISTCILIPIAEDLVFRGIVQGELRRVMPGFMAVIIQAVIFALVHVNPIQISYVIIPALILGAIYEWTRSIYVPIILHMIFNFFGAGLPMIFEGNQTVQSGIVIAEILLIIPAAVAMMYLYKRRRRDLEDTGMHDGQAGDAMEESGLTDIQNADANATEAARVSENTKIWKHQDI